MSKHNRNNNPNFRPTDHQYPQDNRQARGKAASAQTPNHPRSEAERDRDRELLRAIFGEEITANRIMDALKDIATQGKQTVKALDEMQKSFIDYRENLTSIAALMTCAVLAIGNEEEQTALREFLDEDDDSNDQDGSDATEPKQTVNKNGDAKADHSPSTVKFALRTDIDMNELMRAAIAATEEDSATVRKVTEGLSAYLKTQMSTKSRLAMRFMAELDEATRKRVEGSTDPADFEPVVNVLKVSLPTIVTAVADATEIDRTTVDRIAFAELIAFKKMLVNSRVSIGEEAERMVESVTVTETHKTQAGRSTCDINGVEVE